MKKAIKVLAVLLAVCFCSSVLAMAAGSGTAASEVPKQGTFYFGMYPQSNVKDKATVERLDAIQKTTKEDVVKLNGDTYVCCRIERPSKPGGGPFGATYGYYPYEEAYGFPTYWFKYEPIAWRVLDNSDGVLLISEQVLCTHTFNDAVRADNTWENSDVRTWLNGTFMKTAFTAKERAYLLPTSLKNEPNPVRGTYNGVPSSYAGDVSGGYPFVGTTSGNDTTGDKVFLPSFSEITNSDYGFNVGWKDKKGDFNQPVGYYETDILPGEHSARSTSGTDYAQCQGVWANLTVGEGGAYTIEENGVSYSVAVPTCRYWLRTGGWDEKHAAAVLEDGRVSTGFTVDYDIVGIRPMMRVAPNAVADGTVSDPQDANLPFHIHASSDTFHYKERNVKLEADTDVTWESSDPRIADINPETGEVTINRVGTVTITATSKETGEKVTFEMEIEYLWWQQLIRIFLFGWIWY